MSDLWISVTRMLAELLSNWPLTHCGNVYDAAITGIHQMLLMYVSFRSVSPSPSVSLSLSLVCLMSLSRCVSVALCLCPCRWSVCLSVSLYMYIYISPSICIHIICHGQLCGSTDIWMSMIEIRSSCQSFFRNKYAEDECQQVKNIPRKIMATPNIRYSKHITLVLIIVTGQSWSFKKSALGATSSNCILPCNF